MKTRFHVLIAAVAVTATGLAAIAADLKPTRTAFQSSAREIAVGNSVTLKAIVTAVLAEDGIPAGSVEFFDGATSLGTAQLAGVDGKAEASLAVSTLQLGPHPISVKYPGNVTFGGSVSIPEFVLVVGQ